MKPPCFLTDLNDNSFVAASLKDSGSGWTLEDLYFHNPKSRVEISEVVGEKFGHLKGDGATNLIHAWDDKPLLALISGTDSELGGGIAGLESLARRCFQMDPAGLRFALLDAGTGRTYAPGGERALLVGLRQATLDQGREFGKLLGIPPAGIVPAVVSTAGAILGAGMSGTARLLDLAEEASTLITLESGRGVTAVQVLPQGIQSVFAGIQKSLELKFIGSAAKLFYDGLYDFSDIAKTVCAELAQAVDAAVKESGGAAGSLIVSRTPPGSGWLTEVLAEMIGGKALHIAVPGAHGFANPGNFELHTGYLGLFSLLRFGPDDAPWMPDLSGDRGTLAALATALEQSGVAVMAGVGALEAEESQGSSAAEIADASLSAEEEPSGPKAEPETKAKEEPKGFVAQPSTPRKMPGLHRISPPVASPSEAPKTSPMVDTPVPTPSQNAPTPQAPAAKVEPVVAPSPQPETKPKPEAKPAPKPEAKPAPKPEAKPEAKPAPKPETKAKGKQEPTKSKAGAAAVVAPVVEEKKSAAPAAAPVKSFEEWDKKEAATTDKRKRTFIYAGAGVAAVVVIALLVMFMSGGSKPEAKVAQTSSASAPASTSGALKAPAERAATAAPKPANPAPANNAASNEPADPYATTSDPYATGAATTAAMAPATADLLSKPVIVEVDLPVNSVPEGAQVFLDGQYVGETPFTIRGMREGDYVVEVVLPGYQRSIHPVSIKGGSTPEIPLVEMALMTGTLTVTSDPLGVPFSIVSADGEPREVARGLTPESVEGIPYGRYRVIYSRAGWPEFSTRARVGDDEPGAHYKYLQGTGVFTTDPSGAQIINSDGEVMGVTPLTLDALPAGIHNFTLSLDGYETETARIVVETDGEASVHFDLLNLDRIVRADELDEAPSVIVKIEPELNFGLSKPERVEVVCLVDRDGFPVDPVIDLSSNERLNQPVLDAVKQWRFKPGSQRDRAVRSIIRIPFDFTPKAQPSFSTTP